MSGETTPTRPEARVPARVQSGTSTAPGAAGAGGRIRVTHPFHPLCGREFEFVSHRHAWSQDRVCIRDDHGQLISLPARWTSAVAEDPFVVIAAGRSPLHIATLPTLAALVRRLRHLDGLD